MAATFAFLIFASLIVSVVLNVLLFCIGVHLMGRAAQAINQLKADKAGLQANLDQAQKDLTDTETQLAAAQANAYDADDVAAINDVLNPPSTSTATVIDTSSTPTASPTAS